jgi:hypothetical protein
MPAVNGVGEPCAGEPHARFEVAGTGNGADLAKDTGVAQPTGKPAATKAPGPKASKPPRQSPTLHPGRDGSVTTDKVAACQLGPPTIIFLGWIGLMITMTSLRADMP